MMMIAPCQRCAERLIELRTQSASHETIDCRSSIELTIRSPNDEVKNCEASFSGDGEQDADTGIAAQELIQTDKCEANHSNAKSKRNSGARVRNLSISAKEEKSCHP